MNKLKIQLAWQHRRFLLKAVGVGLVVGLFIALCIPKEYEAGILLAPESISERTTNDAPEGWSGTFLNETKERDAITPDYYPHIVSSPLFLTALFDIPVQTIDCPPDSTLTLYNYIDQHQHRPWWSFLQTAFSKVVGLLTGSFFDNPRKVESNYTAALSDSIPTILALSAKDMGIASAINSRISISPDVKTRTVSIACRMQDPLVARIVADSVSRRIQAYVTEYRTNKEREALAAAQTLQQQAREKYYQAQESQAAFEDHNRNLATRNAQKELVKLRILTAQAYQEYTRTTLQVHAAETQVIRVRPVFAVIQPATTPVRPASPSKVKYMAAFALLGLLTGYARIGFFGVKKKISVGKSVY